MRQCWLKEGQQVCAPCSSRSIRNCDGKRKRAGFQSLATTLVAFSLSLSLPYCASDDFIDQRRAQLPSWIFPFIYLPPVHSSLWIFCFFFSFSASASSFYWCDVTHFNSSSNSKRPFWSDPILFLLVDRTFDDNETFGPLISIAFLSVQSLSPGIVHTRITSTHTHRHTQIDREQL